MQLGLPTAVTNNFIYQNATDNFVTNKAAAIFARCVGFMKPFFGSYAGVVTGFAFTALTAVVLDKYTPVGGLFRKYVSTPIYNRLPNLPECIGGKRTSTNDEKKA